VPRAGLTTLRVVQEAEDVADEVGLTNMTLAAIAPRLGVRMPSLYKHVAGMNALQRLVSIRAKNEMADVFARAAAGKAGAQALTAMFRACRTWAKAHPGRYAATVQAPEPVRRRTHRSEQRHPEDRSGRPGRVSPERRRRDRRGPRAAGHPARFHQPGTSGRLRAPGRCRPRLRPDRSRARADVHYLATA